MTGAGRHGQAMPSRWPEIESYIVPSIGGLRHLLRSESSHDPTANCPDTSVRDNRNGPRDPGQRCRPGGRARPSDPSRPPMGCLDIPRNPWPADHAGTVWHPARLAGHAGHRPGDAGRQSCTGHLYYRRHRHPTRGQGESILAEMLPRVLPMHRQLLATLEPAEQMELLRLLRKLVKLDASSRTDMND